MSPIPPKSELGRLIAIKKELQNLLTKISVIIQLCSSNTNIRVIELKVKLLVANIKRVKALRTSYLQLPERDRQDFNEELNSITTIISSGETIKNVRINSQTLNSLIHNLRSLSQQITTAISQTANLVLIIDTRDRISLASSRLPSRPVPRLLLPPPGPPSPFSAPPPYSAPPALQRQRNIGIQPTSLVRQPATRLLLEDLDLTPVRTSSIGSSTSTHDPRLGLGKKYFRARKITRRKRGNKKTKTRRA
jgi:hypothetical protein